MSRTVFVPISREKRRYIFENQIAYPFALSGEQVDSIRFKQMRVNVGYIQTPTSVIASGIVNLAAEIAQTESITSSLLSRVKTNIFGNTQLLSRIEERNLGATFLINTHKSTIGGSTENE